MTVNFIYPSGVKNFPRSYIKGFVGSSDVSNMMLVDNHLIFDYLFPVYTADWVIFENFFEPNSNVYSTDFIFDPDASVSYNLGVPFVATVGIEFYVMLTEPVYRIRVLSTLTPLETETADLAPLPGYWNNPF